MTLLWDNPWYLIDIVFTLHPSLSFCWSLNYSDNSPDINNVSVCLVGDDDKIHAAVCQKCCEKKQDKVFCVA